MGRRYFTPKRGVNDLRRTGDLVMSISENIQAQIQDVLQPFAKEGQTIDDDTELVADLGLDSVQVMELLLEIEDRFDISIPLNILPDVRTVHDLSIQLQKITDQT